MKSIQSISIIFLAMLFNSCSVVGGIFKAGMWWGIFLVVGFIALVIYLISRGGGSKK